MQEDEKARLGEYWLRSAEEDLAVADDLFKLKRFQYCLFFCQLALEKVLKAIFVKRNNTFAPPIHNLVRLADVARVQVGKTMKERLSEITTFNIEARYDVYKEKLYRKA